MLKRITKKATQRNIIAYDLEWYPESYKLRLVGVYDENEEYRYYRKMKDFIDGELTVENKGKWFYAHAGGLADINFVLHYLVSCPEYQIEALFSGSSAFIVTIKRDNMEWLFVDSYWLLRAPLKKIGESLGFEKLDCDFDAPLEELVIYNERDCELLYKAVKSFEEELLSLGGELQMTIASSAMNLFKRQYLSGNITTGSVINEISKNAYFASRVEVFTKKGKNLFYYDINSSFPHSMTNPLPGNYIGHSDKLNLDRLCIAEVLIDIPEMYFPPLPLRMEGRIFFPTGTWRGYYCGEDLKLLLEVGGKILHVYEVFYFLPTMDLAEYAKNIYKLKENADNDPFKRNTYKLLLNSLYGKFAENGDRKRIHVNPDKKVWDRMKKEPELWERIQPGIYMEETHDVISHAHVPIPVYVTAYSRVLMYRYMIQCDNFWYCDTDGFATDINHLSVGTKLGELKLEKEVDEAIFVAPKFYRMDSYIRTKGFPRLTIEEFEMLLAGKDLAFDRMKRVKEGLRKGNLKPEGLKLIKGLRNVVPKRHMYKNGTSRPWTVDELIDKFSK